MSNKLAVQKWRTKTKINLINALGGKCCKCGYNKCIGALSFHHLDPNTKDNTVSNLVANPRKISVIIEECKKCILLCHNCHSEFHADLWRIEDISIPQLDENIINQEIQNDKLCEICQKPTFNTNYCSRKCQHLSMIKSST